MELKAQQERAAAFREMHRGPEILILPNAWDVASARAARSRMRSMRWGGRRSSLIHPNNLASIKVAERLGEKLQGRTEVFGQEVLIYGIDRTGWSAAQKHLSTRAS